MFISPTPYYFSNEEENENVSRSEFRVQVSNCSSYVYLASFLFNSWLLCFINWYICTSVVLLLELDCWRCECECECDDRNSGEVEGRCDRSLSSPQCTKDSLSEWVPHTHIYDIYIYIYIYIYALQIAISQSLTSQQSFLLCKMSGTGNTQRLFMFSDLSFPTAHILTYDMWYLQLHVLNSLT
jgi:hypothetical protein